MLLAFLQFGMDLMEEFSKLGEECLTFPRNIKKSVQKLSCSLSNLFHTGLLSHRMSRLPLSRSPVPAAVLSPVVSPEQSAAFDSPGHTLLLQAHHLIHF